MGAVLSTGSAQIGSEMTTAAGDVKVWRNSNLTIKTRVMVISELNVCMIM